MRTTIIYAILMAFALPIGITVESAYAVPVKVTFGDTIYCDKLYVPNAVDELGRGGAAPGTLGYPFPLDETIRVAATETYWAACEDRDNRDMADALIHITNTTSPKRSFKALWYVGDPNTYLSNVDGIVLQQGAEQLGAGFAFRIDATGMNRPLLSESIAADGIFEPGETWEFVVQDFQDFSLGTGPAADEISSIGVAAGSRVGASVTAHHSSGSIIAIPVPEPSVALLFGSGLMAFISKRGRLKNPDAVIRRIQRMLTP